MFEQRVDECDAEATLTRVADLRALRDDTEVAIIVAAAHFADLNHLDYADAAPLAIPGMERSIRLGGIGTPHLLEFAIADIAASLGTSPYGARLLLADTLDLRYRLPRLWQLMAAKQIPVWQARKIAAMTRLLDRAQAAHVDAHVAKYAPGLTWGRLAPIVDAKIIEADPEAAEQRRRDAEATQCVHTGRVTEHGLKTIFIKTLATHAIWFDARINQIADALQALGNTEPDGVRRALAVGILANPAQALILLDQYATHAHQGQPDPAATDEPLCPDPAEDPDDHPDAGDAAPATGNVAAGDVAALTKALARIDPATLLPPVTLYLHLSQDTFDRDTTGVARFEGAGPIPLDQAKDFLRHTNVSIKPVIDLENLAPVDAYETPDRLREAIHLRTPADVFPYTTNTTRTQDLDHTIGWHAHGPPGQTSTDNLAPMTRFHHRIKTFGTWQIRQPFPGIVIWQSPQHDYYLVDHTGTHRLGKNHTRRPPSDITAELIPAHTPLEYTHAHAA